MKKYPKLSPVLKTGTNLKLIQLLVLCVFLTFSSCKDDPVPPKPEPPIDTTHYTLEGTKWKLVAFVDAENNTSRPPLGKDGIVWTNTYTLDFNEHTDTTKDNTIVLPFWSQMDINDLTGDYVVNYNDTTLKAYAPFMNSGVLLDYENDEENYDLALYKSKEFKITADTLKLFYNDKKNYLKFSRRTE